MKPEEIRIGNIVNFRHGLLRIEPGIREFEFSDFYWWAECNSGEDICDPVAITDEWLSLFFELEYGEYTIINKGWPISICLTEYKKWSINIAHEYQITEVENRHELQNIYFDLTGKELEINSSADQQHPSAQPTHPQE